MSLRVTTGLWSRRHSSRPADRVKRVTLGYGPPLSHTNGRQQATPCRNPQPVRFGEFHNEMPRFHAIKLSWRDNSDFVRSTPLATPNAYSNSAFPDCSIVESPLRIGPASKSMMSAIRWASCELDEIFTTGAIGFPVGVPRPVVNSTKFAPAATCAVTHSTSLPGVHNKFRPGSVTHSG